MSRAWTTEEVKEKFLKQAAIIAKYWAQTHPNDSLKATQGTVFSMLVMLDGGSMAVPGFVVIPQAHEDDEKYHKDQGENYYTYPKLGKLSDLDIAGSLHDCIKDYE